VATKSDSRGDIEKALTSLERVAGQLTSAMMNPAPESKPSDIENPSSELTKF